MQSSPTIVLLLSLGLLGCPVDEEIAIHPATPRQLDVVEHPTNPLGCVVEWYTEVPATSRVEYGPEGDYRYVVEDDELVTFHQVTLFGLRANTTNRLLLFSETEDGDAGQKRGLAVVTDPLPFEFVDPVVTAYHPEAMQPGWTLATVIVGQPVEAAAAVIYDQEGEAVWYHALEGEELRADVVAQLVDGDRVLVGAAVPPGQTPVEVDLAGEVVWEGPIQPEGVATEDSMHHDFSRLDNGNYLVLRYGYAEGLTDVLEEIDADGNSLWSWSTGDHTDVIGDIYPHGNAVFVDADEDAAYFNTRSTSALYKIDRATGEVLWTLGDDGDFEFVGENDFPWFSLQHAPELTDEGTILLFDNGTEGRGFSRAVEYAVDEEAMTAEIVWEYPGALAEDVWETTYWGDADRLENGNTLVTAAREPNFSPTGRVFEVTEDGTKAWEMVMTAGGTDTAVGVYQADRIPVLVQEL